ncbi:STAS domain-containing protein [Skermania sp. ID1734]|uniref:STAS domain-containing protein n=1 Tax=Skermania sp. ID1734 TaxID=2597516 RepID=UPI00163D89FC|nr:STAS domain-containing protein [Skermania sp. ID1734]
MTSTDTLITNDNHSPNFAITTTVLGSVTVLQLCGDLDLLTSPELKAAIQSRIGADPATIIVDLTDLAFLSCSGIAVLIDTYSKITSGTRFLVVADGPVTRRPMHLIGVDEQLHMHTTLSEALETLTGT